MAINAMAVQNNTAGLLHLSFQRDEQRIQKTRKILFQSEVYNESYRRIVLLYSRNKG